MKEYEIQLISCKKKGEITSEVTPILQSFISVTPSESFAILSLDFSNRAAIKGVLEFTGRELNFVSIATGKNAKKVSQILIDDIQSKILVWDKKVA
ncbi:MAG: hypothetical protein ACI9QD_000786 [Thermoproteota archaeon]|jgi:hypothetical protein